MKRRPFLIFILVIGLLVASMLAFIQSAQFARLLKDVVAKNLPSDLGVEGDFSDLAVKIFPPGLSIRNPKLRLAKRNIVDLPEGSSIQAEELHLIFRPFQMFSGTIRVNEIRIVNGEVDLSLDPEAGGKKKKKGLRPEFQWDELFRIRAEAISAENTRFRIRSPKPEMDLQFLASQLRVGQWEDKSGLGYELLAELKQIRGALPRAWAKQGLPDSIEQITARARVNVKGLQIDSLSLTSHGMEVQSSGEVKGNLLSWQGLGLEANVSAKGEFNEAIRLIEANRNLNLPRSQIKKPLPLRGTLSFNGKLAGSLERIVETARLEGTLSVTDFQYQAWKADEIRVEGQWDAGHGGVGGKGGELSVTRAHVQSREIARNGAYQPGSGGRIEAGPLKLTLGTGAMPSISVPVSIQKAHIHWLAAPALDGIFGLDFRISGNTTVTYEAPKMGVGQAKSPWLLKTALNKVQVTDFSLDNQKFRVPKPLRRVLKVPKIELDGEITVDPEGIKPAGVTVSLPKTKFQLAGKIGFESGFDLYAAGPVQLDDIGEISENPIRGEGILRTHVHGPSSRVLVDFDADLDNAEYLNLKLGNLRGVITWDDKPSHLIFHNVQVAKRRTAYSVDGMLDLGAESETVNLKVNIPQADVQDFIQIFSVLTKDLWWFPKTLSGAMSGTASVTGGVDFKKLVIGTRLNGSSWEYLGERIKSVSLAGGYDQGRYHLSEFKAQKRNGSVDGRISFDESNDQLDWEVGTTDLTVTDLDLLAQLDVPIRGKLDIKSSGSGRSGSIRSFTSLELSDFSVRGVWMAPSQISVRADNGIARVNGSAIGGQGTLEAIYDFNPRNTSSIRAELSQFDFSPMLLLINPKLSKDKALVGKASGLVQLSFNAGAIERSSGKVEIRDYLLQKSGTSFRLSQPVAFDLSDGSFDIRGLGIRGNQGLAVLSLQSRQAQVEGAISGDIDVSALEFLSGDIARASGTAELDFALNGSIKEPKIFGRASLGGESMLLEALESPFENITGAIQIRQNVVSIQNLEADLAGGRFTADGKVEVFADRLPSISIRGNLGGNRIKIYPFQFAKVRGWLKLQGSQLPYSLEGAVTVDSALTKEKVLTQRQAEGLKAARYTPPPRITRESDYPLFKLNIEATADSGVVVQNDLFDLEMKGKVVVINTIDAPRILGSAEVLHGKMVFKDNAFQIQSATISFDNPTVMNPSFNLVSSTEVNGTKIQLFAAGRLDDWKIDLSSNPVMPESEILSLLTLGLTSTETRRLRAEDRTVFERGEAASLLLHSLDFNREVQAKTGLQIQLDESVNTQIGTSAFRPSTQEGANAAAPKIVIKRRIGKQLDLSYGSTVGIGTNNQRVVNAELHLTPGVSILGVWDNFETFETEGRNSYGLDLKLQKRFK